jgi:hypothetical protein
MGTENPYGILDGPRIEWPFLEQRQTRRPLGLCCGLQLVLAGSVASNITRLKPVIVHVRAAPSL